MTLHDTSAIELPIVRTFRTWNPQQLLAAERSADSGNLRLAVDLCDWLLGDDKVRGSLDGRIGRVFGHAPTFAPALESEPARTAANALAEDWAVMFPEAEAVQVLYWAILLGIGPAVLRYRESDTGRDLPVLEFYHPQPLSFEPRAHTWRTSTGGTAKPLGFGDGIWLGHMPFGTFRPWSLGLWRPVSRWVLLKQYAIADWGRLGETASRNVVEIEAGVNASREQRADLANSIADMARDSTIVLPAGFRYSLVEASAVTKDLYDLQIKTANEAIGNAILGNVSKNVDSGSRSASEVDERGEHAIARRDAAAWCTTARDQSLAVWAEDNFGNATLAPRPKYATDPVEDRKAKVDVFNGAIDAVAKAEAIGFDVDRASLANSFGLGAFLRPGVVRSA